jgi:hypothetical protein
MNEREAWRLPVLLCAVRDAHAGATLLAPGSARREVSSWHRDQAITGRAAWATGSGDRRGTRPRGAE